MVEETKVLLISDLPSSIIVRSIREGIESVGYDVIQAGFALKEISAMDRLPDLIFIYVDESISTTNEALIYIRDHCVEDDKKLFLVGYESDIQTIKKLIPDEIIGAEFRRPIEASQIGARFLSVIEQIESNVNKKHILAVDDSGVMLRTIKEWLSKKYKVSIVNSATNAISFLATNHPDLVLLDYEMPICSGPQMLEMIRAEERTKNLPVIFLTAHGDRESVEKVLSHHPAGYLLKTMSADKIIAAIDSFFATQKAKTL
ncbi:MAG: response regulator [Lachnospiraceae bacterium]|nr:response regulator [Lachnospiraceae bacterium]